MTLTEWPHLVDELRKKRDCLTEVIEAIERNFAITPQAGEPPVDRGGGRL